MRRFVISLAALAFFVSPVAAELYVTGFDSATLETPGFVTRAAAGVGIDRQAYGDPIAIWFEASSQIAGIWAGGMDEEVQTAIVHSGDQAWRFGNSQVNMQAIVCAGVQLFEAAGKCGSVTTGRIGTTGFGIPDNQHGEDNTTPAPVGNTHDATTTEYWWRTAATAASAGLDTDASVTDLDGRRMSYISYNHDSANGSVRADIWGQRFTGGGTGYEWYRNVISTGGGVSADGNGVTGLSWGTWYHTTEEVVFSNGLLADDLVGYTIRDATGAIVAQVETGSWHPSYYLGDYAPAGTNQAVDTWGLRLPASDPEATGLGIVFDEFSFATHTVGSCDGEIPEPATVALVALGALGLAVSRRAA